MNHYKTLNVSRRASQEEIRQAYLRAIAETHPDRDPSESAIARARDINLAFEILSDPEARDHFNKTYHRGKVDAPYYPLAGHRPYGRFDSGYGSAGCFTSVLGVVAASLIVALIASFFIIVNSIT